MSILPPSPGLLEHVNSAAAASVYMSFPSFSSLESVAHQAAHLSQGFRDRAKRKIANIRAAFSIYFLQQQSVSTLVCLRKRAAACNCPLFCSCFPPSDFGPVRWQICHHMSPITHAEIDTLESAGKIPIHHAEAVDRLCPETSGGRRVTTSHRILGK